MPAYVAVTMGVGEGGACLMKKTRPWFWTYPHQLKYRGGGDNAWDKMIRWIIELCSTGYRFV